MYPVLAVAGVCWNKWFMSVHRVFSVCVWYVQCVCGVGMCVHMHVCIQVCVHLLINTFYEDYSAVF